MIMVDKRESRQGFIAVLLSSLRMVLIFECFMIISTFAILVDVLIYSCINVYRHISV